MATFAATVGELMLASGAAAAEAMAAMLDIIEAAGAADLDIDLNYSQITLSYRPADGVPVTRVETVYQRTFNYGKFTDVSALVKCFCQGELTVDLAKARAQQIAAERGPYPWWLTRLAAGFAGAGAALVFGGGWVVVIVAFIANVLLDWLLGVLGRHEWLTFFMQAVAGFVAIVAAIIVHGISPSVDTSRLVVSVIIVMFAGMTSTGAVQDAITGWYLTGVGRIFEAVMNTIGLIAGLQFGLLIARLLGITLTVSERVSMGALQLPVMLLAAAFVATNFCLVAQNPGRVILPTALVSALAYGIFNAANAAQPGAVWSNGAAACVAGAVAVVLAQWLKAPVAAIAVCAILTLVPGFALYQGLVEISRSPSDGVRALVTALGTAFGLAGGLMFGEYAMIVLWRLFHLAEDRYFSPVFVAPYASQSHLNGARQAQNRSR